MVFAGCGWWKPVPLIGVINRVGWLKPIGLFRWTGFQEMNPSDVREGGHRDSLNYLYQRTTTCGDRVVKRWLFHSKRFPIRKCWFCCGTTYEFTWSFVFLKMLQDFSSRNAFLSSWAQNGLCWGVNGITGQTNHPSYSPGSEEQDDAWCVWISWRVE